MMLNVLYDWILGVRNPREEKLMFLTHTPDSFRLGEVIEGKRITRRHRIAPSELADGGTRDCWEIFGVPERT